MPLFGKDKYTLVKIKKKDIPEGLWTKCPECETPSYNKALKDNLNVCLKCGFHLTLTAKERIRLLIDEGTFEELDNNLHSADPLAFKGPKTYKEKLKNDLETLCNKYVAEGGKTEVVFMTREEMLRTCRYKPDFPADKGEQARVVIHAGFPIPCGGTPVSDLSEIGHITVRKIRQEGKNVRIGYDIA